MLFFFFSTYISGESIPIGSYQDPFAKHISVVLKFEGGYFAEEKTNFGIMQGTYNAYRISKGLEKNDIRLISEKEVWECYYIRYYKKGGCDTMNNEMALVHFDTSINFGITGAKNIMKNINNCSNSKDSAIQYCDLRIKKRYDIVKNNNSKKKFLKGWVRRDNKLKEIVKQL
jgi:lysozyme family protein